MDQQTKGRNASVTIQVDLFKSSTNRRLATVAMSHVPRVGEIVWIESRSVAMMVEDVIWNAEADTVQLYLGPDRNRLDR